MQSKGDSLLGEVKATEGMVVSGVLSENSQIVFASLGRNRATHCSGLTVQHSALWLSLKCPSHPVFFEHGSQALCLGEGNPGSGCTSVSVFCSTAGCALVAAQMKPMLSLWEHPHSVHPVGDPPYTVQSRAQEGPQASVNSPCLGWQLILLSLERF
jgi:hypothetical protein